MSKVVLPWMMLFSRLVLFAGFQAFLALGFFLAGSTHAWNDGATWWPIAVTLTNVVCVAILVHGLQAEGKSYWSLFHVERQHLKRDLLTLLGLFIIAGAVSYF